MAMGLHSKWAYPSPLHRCEITNAGNSLTEYGGKKLGGSGSTARMHQHKIRLPLPYL